MSQEGALDLTRTNRELVRFLRAGVLSEPGDAMPESLAWHAFVELRRRGEREAGSCFLSTVQRLHARRSLGGCDLPTREVCTEEHRLVANEQPLLADLWRAYKRCLRDGRTGPAALLLRDLREELLTGPAGAAE